MTVEVGQLIVWVVIGALAGSVVGWLVRGRRRGFGALPNLLIGMIGAVVGGFLFDLLNVSVGGLVLTFTLTDLVAAIIGSLLLVALLAVIRR